MSGRFLVLDGPSGVGKTTVTALLADLLAEDGWDVHRTKEPTHTQLGETARYGTDDYHGLTLACLVTADRYQHLETEIRPALAAAKLVICDRYLATSLVLQRLDGVDGEFIWALNQYVDRPDLTIILTGDPTRSRARAAARGIHSRFHRGGPGAGQQERERYAEVAVELAEAGFPVHLHDIGEQTPNEVAAELLIQVKLVLGTACGQQPTGEAACTNAS
ncbi:dTMP kinase [Micromonospora halophytica]|uniref:Thymidylate kinase n=1 Tax=Micromonospora halophytica TaxID=47864 RepID=A0A1C5HBI8_9ACTN|nr:dTMP kinase [Micromonospora halophytica]SCG43398.1 thymidylate kinase [Micromonospora halophytica]